MFKTSLFAVVVDYFEPVKGGTKDNYQMNVKVIDDTLNKNDSLMRGERRISFAYIQFCNA